MVGGGFSASRVVKLREELFHSRTRKVSGAKNKYILY